MRSIIHILHDIMSDNTDWNLQKRKSRISQISAEFHMNEIDFYPMYMRIVILRYLSRVGTDAKFEYYDNVKPIIRKYKNEVRENIRYVNINDTDIRIYSNMISKFRILLQEL